jgi:(p)ppGpp synthase/HD superfamily hydrolase
MRKWPGPSLPAETRVAYSERLDGAFALARQLHSGQTRKGSSTPYLSHLLAVAAIVSEHGGDEDQVIAALLHDAVEDQGGRPLLADIQGRFGDRVAALVEACTDAFDRPKPPWKERKLAYLVRMPEAPRDARLIIAADKLHNLRSMIADYDHAGERLWDRFTATREETLWYYRAVLDALALDWHHAVLNEYRRALDAFRASLRT